MGGDWRWGGCGQTDGEGLLMTRPERAAGSLRHLLACVLLGFLLVGCASTEERTAALVAELSHWEGRSVSELIEQWGPPTSQVPDGRGGDSSTLTTG